MAFTRKSLAGLGLNEEQIEKVMTLHGTSMGDFIPKSELQSKIDEAIKNAPAPNVKDTDDYKTLAGEFDNYKKKVETSAELKKGGVKDKFIDNVFALLEDGKPTNEQLVAIREKFEEYFDDDSIPNNNESNETNDSAPQFGAAVKGQMPSGKESKSFEDVWGIKKK